ncbi:MAG: SDR family oxidoreductase [Gemmatimonadetes bacterium]|nr:SDR family oxidoreductase [Gemmatimonadota bacterium]
MTAYERACEELKSSPRRWLVTGAAGFIGSNLVERLLRLGQPVVALDNLSTGHRYNVEDAIEYAGASPELCRFIEADVADGDACREACENIDVILHQAALGSVPRSISQPLASHRSNVEGFIELLDAARTAGIPRFVYASSSSVYGDSPRLPKVEEDIGEPLSPYATTKRVDELYAAVYHRTYDIEVVGLRYFNVFGRRQDPDGPYAAVVPRWIDRLLTGEPCQIFGDGETSRDFCYIDNVVQANLLAATVGSDATGAVYNVAFGDRTTLNELYELIRDGLAASHPEIAGREPIYEDFRPGDIRHSLADTTRVIESLGYAPTHSVGEGLAEALDWYAENLAPKA